MLKSKKFWCYEISNQYNLTDEIMASSKLKGKFYEDALFFFELMGTGPHPSIKKLQGINSPSMINFNNVLIDVNTIKIIFFLMGNFNITTIKLCNNNFNLKSLECFINSFLKKDHKINNLTYEWNDEVIIDDIKYSYKDIKNVDDEKLIQEIKRSQDLIVSLATSIPSKLEVLCLRGNSLGDEAAIKIFEGLKDENNNIRVLNLFNNNLTNECVTSFSEMIAVNHKLEEINFGKNNLTDEALTLINKNYGFFKMTPEEVEEYKRIDKERQEIIKQNAKLKASKKPEMEVPYLDQIKEVDGETYKLKNDTLKIFNLIHNNFTEKSFDDLLALLNGNSNTVVTIDGRPYTEEQKNILKEVTPEHDYGNRIFLLK